MKMELAADGGANIEQTATASWTTVLLMLLKLRLESRPRRFVRVWWLEVNLRKNMYLMMNSLNLEIERRR